MYKDKVRVRTCGILIEDNKILLLKHEGLGPAGYLWSPPGGGVEFGESAEDCIIREMKEETDLSVSIENFLFVNEYRDSKYHAIELFYKVTLLSGEVLLGKNPELNDQVLTEARFFSNEELAEISQESKHNIFSNMNELEDIVKLSRYYKFDQL